MLNSQSQISLSCLLTWIGFALGFGLLIASEAASADNLGRWGLVALGLTCTFTIHRSLVVRDSLLKAVYEHGRENERKRDLTLIN